MSTVSVEIAVCFALIYWLQCFIWCTVRCASSLAWRTHENGGFAWKAAGVHQWTERAAEGQETGHWVGWCKSLADANRWQTIQLQPNPIQLYCISGHVNLNRYKLSGGVNTFSKIKTQQAVNKINKEWLQIHYNKARKFLCNIMLCTEYMKKYYHC